MTTPDTPPPVATPGGEEAIARLIADARASVDADAAHVRCHCVGRCEHFNAACRARSDFRLALMAVTERTTALKAWLAATPSPADGGETAITVGQYTLTDDVIADGVGCFPADHLSTTLFAEVAALRARVATAEQGAADARAERDEMERALKAAEAAAESCYCPKCGSCGISGCCPPERCHYLPDAARDYREMEAALDAAESRAGALAQALEEIAERMEIAGHAGIVAIARAALTPPGATA